MYLVLAIFTKQTRVKMSLLVVTGFRKSNITFLEYFFSFLGISSKVTMNGEIPSVPITTLAGITSLTDCKYIFNIFYAYLPLNTPYSVTCIN